MGITLFERWSPEYALNNAFADMRQSGLDGLKKHLTSNALRTLKGFEDLSGNPGVSLITSAFMGENAITFFLNKLSECEWTIKDVMKGSETSKAIVGFNYEDEMTGTMEMKMIKEDKIWKIDNLDLPKFEKISLPRANDKQDTE